MNFRVGQKIVVKATDAQVNQGMSARIIEIDEKELTPFSVRIDGGSWRTWVTVDQIEHECAVEALGGLVEPSP